MGDGGSSSILSPHAISTTTSIGGTDLSVPPRKFLFVVPPDRGHTLERRLVLAEEMRAYAHIAWAAGATQAKQLHEWGEDSVAEIEGLGELSSSSEAQVVIFDWIEAVGAFEPQTVDLVLESIGDPKSALKAAERARRSFFIGVWPLLEDPEMRVALGDVLVRVDPWTEALLDSPSVRDREGKLELGTDDPLAILAARARGQEVILRAREPEQDRRALYLATAFGTAWREAQSGRLRPAGVSQWDLSLEGQREAVRRASQRLLGDE